MRWIFSHLVGAMLFRGGLGGPSERGIPAPVVVALLLATAIRRPAGAITHCRYYRAA
ncbi:hypothetical protein AB5I41_31355 [Sphingomonas sp. MMS24-JH45]